MVYLIEGDPVLSKDPNEVFPTAIIQVIIFLSQALTTAEKNYWPIELEASGLV